jgi:hypothetical protein
VIDWPDQLAVAAPWLDAFVASLVARAAQLGLTVTPRSDAECGLAAGEGWIHVPHHACLAGLATPSASEPKRRPARSQQR